MISVFVQALQTYFYFCCVDCVPVLEGSSLNSCIKDWGYTIKNIWTSTFVSSAKFSNCFTSSLYGEYIKLLPYKEAFLKKDNHRFIIFLSNNQVMYPDKLSSKNGFGRMSNLNLRHPASQ